ncbi:PREDICTED: tumor necrosis factor receptor superfamily member 14 [Gekko japonicus]|uniref:Tumor necrosis factor receptor superfamily member 14 n=1 Tax=Gekko japonicus TaxID=146911 RepID=A0ABM1JYV9_GEKJA|nr:PREDICTED: tumor necrosis factor receptor superfamily member 14 [Gekko japonicus]XP_015266646.1 PREDICTED: tumor necrosis factor receptor superfamily member 14 [Gekko japonicus]
MILTSILVAVHLLCSEACIDGEYEINGECCPMCGPGYRVFKSCTSISSTSCLPCIEGTYMDHPHGLTSCFPCRNCDSGSNLTIKERCTYTQNAVCSCASGYYCTHFTGEDCDSCQKHTVAQPGYMVTQAGTETTDTQYVPCPPGTFSTEAMSFSCKPWTNCSESGRTEEKAGTTTSDAVCKKTLIYGDKNFHSHIIAFIIPCLFVLLLAAALIYFFWRRKRKSEIIAAAKQEENLEKDYQTVPVTETNMVEPIQETTQNGSKPAYKAVYQNRLQL